VSLRTRENSSAVPDGSTRLVPLGGLGEVGMNCLAVEGPRDLFALDCGVTFPEKTFGADITHAKLDYLLARRDKLRAIVITHGHEDHIGAVPYLLREVDVPVYAPPYAIALLEKRLEEVEVGGPVDLRPIHSGRSFGVGDDFEIEPYSVHHSLPDAHGLVMRTPAGTIVHTGDFKIESHPVAGQRFDRDVLVRAAERGVRLLLSDSTNIDVEGRAGSEVGAAEGLRDLILSAERRVIVATFASNSYRLAALLELARASRRKVALLGRSLVTHSKIQESLGHLDGLTKLLVPKERMRDVAPGELLVIATGSQGEPPAALSRLARGQHPDLDLSPGDRVILSSRVIPGAELTVHALCDALERRGIEVRHRRTDPSIHSSGHACRDEQREMLELVRPRSFMPVHGTFHHLQRHAALARETGVSDTLVVENGSIVEVDASNLRVVGSTPVGRVHCAHGEPIPDAVLKDRSLIAHYGLAVVAVPMTRDLELAGPTRVTTRGLVDSSDDDDRALVRDAEKFVHAELRSYRGDFERIGDVQGIAGRALKRFFFDETGRKPLVEVIVVHV